MDLDFLVIGDTFVGWEVAVTAAQSNRRVGLIAIPAALDLPNWDLRQLPAHLLREACADWALSACQTRPTQRHADPSQWREFSSHTMTLWQHELDVYRDRLLAARGRIWRGSPMFTGAHSVIVSGTGTAPFRVRAEQTLIATGTRPQRPWFAAGQPAGLHDAARLLESAELPHEACVVGAGVTGLRAACLLAWWGSHVLVIDGCRAPTNPGDGDASDLLSWAEKLDVDFEFGEDVIGLQSHGGRQPVGMTLESGRQLRSESVWLATGRRGRTEELGLEHARLSVDETGRLWCGAQLRTWIPSICAAGDVVGYSAETAVLGWRSEFELPVAEGQLVERTLAAR